MQTQQQAVRAHHLLVNISSDWFATRAAFALLLLRTRSSVVATDSLVVWQQAQHSCAAAGRHKGATCTVTTVLYSAECMLYTMFNCTYSAAARACSCFITCALPRVLQVGNDCSCVAVARKRGIDVLMNKESVRETPTMVCFGDKMRFIGEHAAAGWSTHTAGVSCAAQQQGRQQSSVSSGASATQQSAQAVCTIIAGTVCWAASYRQQYFGGCSVLWCACRHSAAAWWIEQ